MADSNLAATVKWILKFVVVYTLTAVYGGIWIFKQIPFIWRDPQRYFTVTPRKIPSKVKEPETGEHGFLQLAVCVVYFASCAVLLTN